MLSILIPIYNYNVLPLVTELYKQCAENNIAFEILCQDDASESIHNLENEKVNALPYCSFVSLQKNIAHRENRNSLAEQAKYAYLLFIDGDSIIIKSDYIKNYIANLHRFEIVYGGRLHPEKCPSKVQQLRWKYGRFIEDKRTSERKKAPYQSLLFNNTVILKDCFDKVKFDRKMKKYGHDDTQLSYQLSLLHTTIIHIENPVEHGDIDTNAIYVAKTKSSLENLKALYDEHKIEPSFVKLLKLYDFLKKTGLIIGVRFFYSIFNKPIYRNLVSGNASMFLFNLYRIGYLCSL
ncbi:MAG: glycosyltransferase [Flavobacterium sp.]|nr:glycosyltransferase [Flavobacterium sp.]